MVRSVHIIDLEQQIEQFGQNMSTGPNAVPLEQIDTGYHVRTPVDTNRNQRNFWNAEPTHVNQTDILEIPEIVNEAARNNILAQELMEATGLTFPWILSDQDLQDPQIQSFLETVDVHIAKIDEILNRQYNDQNHPDYQYRKALALWAFCALYSMTAPEISLANYSEISLRIRNKLTSNGLIDYFDFIEASLRDSNQTEFGGRTISSDETTIGEFIRNKQGDCTELAYLYRFVGQKAGLDVRFREVDIENFGYPNHSNNVVYLSNNETIFVDVGFVTFNRITMNQGNILDDYQALPQFYINQILGIDTDDPQFADQIPTQILNLETILTLDPDNVTLIVYYAFLLKQQGNLAEADRQIQRALEIGVDDVLLLKSAIIQFYVENPNDEIDPQTLTNELFEKFGSQLARTPMGSNNLITWSEVYKTAAMTENEEFIELFFSKLNTATASNTISFDEILYCIRITGMVIGNTEHFLQVYNTVLPYINVIDETERTNASIMLHQQMVAGAKSLEDHPLIIRFNTELLNLVSSQFEEQRDSNILDIYIDIIQSYQALEDIEQVRTWLEKAENEFPSESRLQQIRNRLSEN